MAKKSQSLQEEPNLKKRIMNRLSIAKVGDVITYHELSTLIGKNVQKEGYHICICARWSALEKYRILFSPIINVGLKRLSESEIARSGDYGADRLHGMAIKELKKLHLGVSNFQGLSFDDKVEFRTHETTFESCQKLTDKNTMSELEKNVRRLKGRKVTIVFTVK